MSDVEQLLQGDLQELEKQLAHSGLIVKEGSLEKLRRCFAGQQLAGFDTLLQFTAPPDQGLLQGGDVSYQPGSLPLDTTPEELGLQGTWPSYGT